MEGSPPHIGHSRRRVTRTVLGRDDDNSLSSTSQAGPSRLPDVSQLVDVNFSEFDKPYDEGDSDDHSTPKIHSSSRLPAPNGETPAARLRALLSLVPNPSSMPMPPPPESVTEHESDFDKGESMNATASIARESLRDIFSRALRAPGDTPQKTRKRRNSIDISEVDANPRVERERAKNKGKRKSLSDEEVENYSRIGQPHASFKSKSQPLTLDVLRQRFMNSRSQSHDQQSSSRHKEDTSDDTADILRELRTSPPAATSTPQHSLRMSIDSQYQMQSNLLDQDSEMERAIEELDSYDAQYPANIVPIQEASYHNRSEDKTVNQNGMQRRSSGTFQNIVGQHSSPSPSPLRPGEGTAEEPYRQRERLWSFPKSPTRPSTSRVTQEAATREGVNRTSLFTSRNKTMTPSLLSTSSRSSSIGSQAEYRERINSLERDYEHEREREWNKRHPKLTRATSSLNLRSPPSSERPRTQSFNTKDSAGDRNISPSITTGLRRQHSFTSSIRSSPSGSSHASHEEDIVPEVAHERERNWNSPRPVWHDHPPPRHLPTTASPSQTALKSPTTQLTHSHSITRITSPSIYSVKMHSDDSSDPPSTSTKFKSPGRDNSFNHQTSRPRPALTPESSQSLRSHLSPHINGGFSPRSTSPMPSPSNKKRHTFIHNTDSFNLSSSDLKQSRIIQPTGSTPTSSLHSPSKSVSAISSTTKHKSTIRVTELQRTSHIPVISPKNARTSHSVRAIDQKLSQTHPPLHFNTSIENGSNGSDDHGAGDLMTCHDQSDTKTASLTSNRPQELTAKQKPTAPPLRASPQRRPSSPLSPPLNVDDMRQHSDLSYGSLPGNIQPNPLPSPSEETVSFSSTPLRGSSSTLKFKTPSPPTELPELPGPPSTDEDSDHEAQWSNPPQARLFLKADGSSGVSMLKTPKPPGGWATTPAKFRRNRAYSDSASVRSVTIDGIQDAIEPYHFDAGDASKWSAMQTPKPPGGWMSTPVPPHVQFVDRSVETDTEPEAALDTPASSPSNGNTQTPAAPGGWAQTPAARKSIRKVRFNSQAAQTRETDDSLSQHYENELSDSAVDMNIKVSQPQQQLLPPTPELFIPISPSRNPRKAPSIRILDAFGNEQQEDETVRREEGAKQLARSNSIRIASTLGDRVGNSTYRLDESDEDIPPVSGTRNELLSRVRKGLDELVQEIQEMDRPDSSLDTVKMKELDLISKNARESRRILSQRLELNSDLKEKLGPRESMQKSRLLIPTTVHQLSKFRLAPSLFLGILFLQIILAIVMYRVAAARARDMFLTTYYDPFYPDLHLYSSKTHIFWSPSQTVRLSWFSVFDSFRQHGWKDSAMMIWDTVTIILAEMQYRIWETWGSDVTNQAKSWPPT